MKIFRLFVVFTLTCFGLSPAAHAVVPPPDGGYPGFNTAEGQNALLNLTTGVGNTAVGWFSLASTTTGSFNTAAGAGTLLFNTGDQNTAFGAAALLYNGPGTENTAVGTAALLNNLDGILNTALGVNALFLNTGGSGNTAIGFQALSDNTTGGNNTTIGFDALLNNFAGSNNIALGAGAGSGVTSANNVICIGALGAHVSDSCYIDNIYGAGVDPINSLVGVDANGKLGTTTSARRFKRDIQPMENASEAILALKPVTFHYKSDVKNTPCFGLVAEDLEKVNPHLVLREKNGQLLSVRYEQINAMLLNEFLKEHRKVQKLEAALEAVNARMEKQEERLEKVSAKVEMREPARQVAITD